MVHQMITLSFSDLSGLRAVMKVQVRAVMKALVRAVMKEALQVRSQPGKAVVKEALQRAHQVVMKAATTAVPLEVTMFLISILNNLICTSSTLRRLTMASLTQPLPSMIGLPSKI